MARRTEGVKKINEYIMKDGRTLIVTDESVPFKQVADGTLKINPISGELFVKLSSVNEWTKLTPINMFDPKSIGSTLLDDGAVSPNKLDKELKDGFEILKKLKYTPSLERINLDGNLVVSGDITGARVFNPWYADYAEGFEPSIMTEAGDLIALDSQGKTEPASCVSNCVIGVHSDCYAQLNDATEEEVLRGEKVPVGILGKVPVKVKGIAKVGDYIKPLKNGIAIASLTKESSIGRVIERKDSEEVERVLCLITL